MALRVTSQKVMVVSRQLPIVLSCHKVHLEVFMEGGKRFTLGLKPAVELNLAGGESVPCFRYDP